MASIDDVRRAIAALEAVLGSSISLDAINLVSLDHGFQVDLTTPRPGDFIGRRGSTADAIRLSLANWLQVEEVVLNVYESPAEDPPFDPPAGVREPRRPRPGPPPVAARVRVPPPPERPVGPPPPREPGRVPPPTGRPIPPPDPRSPQQGDQPGAA